MSTGRVVLICQARTSSSRLPGKVLLNLGGAPAIVQLMRRIARCSEVDASVVATSDRPSDDQLVSVCDKEGIECHRGSLEDVLGRYVGVARATAAVIIVRVTGDCPLHDAALIDQCIRLYRREQSHAAYVSNADDRRTFPRGLDTEVFTRAALEAAFEAAHSPFDREHVTPYIRRTAQKRTFDQPVDLSALRWTLDYPDDYTFIAQVYEWFSPSIDFGASDVYRLLLEHPELIRLETMRPPTAEETEQIRARIRCLLGA